MTQHAQPKQKVKLIIAFDEFKLVHGALRRSRCKFVWCAYSRTTCYVRMVMQQMREWWSKTNGNAPGFANYERVLTNAINVENRLYWMFWTYKMAPCQECYEELVKAVLAVFKDNTLDMRTGYRPD